MQINIHPFAALKDLFGPPFSMEVDPDTSVGQVMERLSRKKDGAASFLRASRVAVREELVGPDFVLSEGDELFLLPPSSGG